MTANYDNFINSFIKQKDSPFLKNLNVSIMHFVKIDSKLYEGIKKESLTLLLFYDPLKINSGFMKRLLRGFKMVVCIKTKNDF